MPLKDIEAGDAGFDYVLEVRKQFDAGKLSIEELREWLMSQWAFHEDIRLIGHFLKLPFTGTTQPLKANTYGWVPSNFRATLETIDRTRMSSDSRVYEIGSGLGYQSMLFGLLTGAQVTGVEWNAKHCRMAAKAARALRLNNVNFVSANALNLNYADADVMYLYTPFYGEMLERFIAQCILPVARAKPITLAAHGPQLDPLYGTRWLDHDKNPGPRGLIGCMTILRASPESLATTEEIAAKWQFWHGHQQRPGAQILPANAGPLTRFGHTVRSRVRAFADKLTFTRTGSKGAQPTMDKTPIVGVETVTRIARLARIKVAEEDKPATAAALSNILDFAGQLNQVDTDGVEPMTSVADVTLAMRDDVVTDGNRRELVLVNATESADDSFFTVPKVVE